MTRTLILSVLLLIFGHLGAQDFKTYLEKGDSCVQNRTFNQAISYYKKALNTKPERIITEPKEVIVFLKLGDTYSKVTEYQTALEYYFKYLEKDIVQNNDSLLSDVYNKIGISYRYLNQDKQALKFYKKCIETSRTDSIRIGIAYNNIAIIYKNMGDIEKTKDYYKEALVYFEKKNYYRGIVATVMNIGVSEMEDGNIETALSYFDRAKELAKSHNDTLNYIMISINLGDFYTQTGDYEQAETYLDWALTYSRNQNEISLISESYKSLVKLYKTQKNYEQAFKYLELFKASSDSITIHNSSREYAELEAKYSIREKEKENELLIKDQLLTASKVESQRKYILGLSGLLFLFIVFIGIFFLQRRKVIRAKRILETQNKEITKSQKQLEDLNHQYEKLIDKYEGGNSDHKPSIEIS